VTGVLVVVYFYFRWLDSQILSSFFKHEFPLGKSSQRPHWRVTNRCRCWILIAGHGQDHGCFGYSTRPATALETSLFGQHARLFVLDGAIDFGYLSHPIVDAGIERLVGRLWDSMGQRLYEWPRHLRIGAL